MCLAGASFAMGATWSWRSSLEGSQVAGCALPRIHGTHIYIAALIEISRLVAHPLITERESLIINVAVHSQSPGEVLCARDTSRTLLQVLSGMRCFNYTATATRDINSSVQVGKRARNRCIFHGAGGYAPSFSKRRYFRYAKNRKTSRWKERINGPITGSVPNTGNPILNAFLF